MNNRYGCYNRTPDMKCGYLENATDAKCKGCKHLMPVMHPSDLLEKFLEEFKTGIVEYRERICKQLLDVDVHLVEKTWYDENEQTMYYTIKPVFKK